ncbi:MAG: hypothetical protein SNJ52_05630 [Verrucomicrobiia bacterium]
MKSAERSRSPQFIIVDLDGTLYRAGPLARRLVWRLRASLPLLLYFQWIRKRAWVGRDFGSYSAYQEALLEALSRGVSSRKPSLQEWLATDFWEGFLTALEMVPRNELLLHQLFLWKHQGSRLACVSDYKEIDKRLQRLRVDPELFELRLSAEEMGALKPACRIGEILKDRFPFVPSDAVWIGDRPETDGALAGILKIPYLDVKAFRPENRADG